MTSAVYSRQIPIFLLFGLTTTEQWSRGVVHLYSFLDKVLTMDPARRSTRHLESRNSPTTTSPNDALRPLSNDSGRVSMLTTDRTPINESIASNGTSPSSLRVTPLDGSHNSVNDANQQSNRSGNLKRNESCNLLC